MKPFHKNQVAKFGSRWVIRAELTTDGPLHVGDGSAREIHQRLKPADKQKQEHDVSTVCTDFQGRACVPGSSIKGALRARVKASLRRGMSGDGEAWWRLLGLEQADKEGAEGGQVEFSDALILDKAPPLEFLPMAAEKPRGKQDIQDGAPPYWLAERFTGVAVSVSLDRQTRAAREALLYHLEYVPCGVTFTFEMTGDNLSDDDVARLLALLDTFNDEENPVSLGAQASNSWGRVRCAPPILSVYTSADLQRDLAGWLHGDGSHTQAAGYAACREVDEETRRAIHARKHDLRASGKKPLNVSVRLHFPGPLLVCDPQQDERVARASKDNVPPGQKPPDATPILDERGLPMIPAKAVRGVLRSRAEMILRTLGLPALPPYDTPAVGSIAEVAALDLANQLFGASGWRSPLQLAPLRFQDRNAQGQAVNPAWLNQEFVANDRFTGGGSEGKKFNARAVVGATFEGSFTLDPERIAALPASTMAHGLLALVLRDLAEGDLTFGSKSSIGYGAGLGICTVTGYDSLEKWFESPEVIRSLDTLRAASPSAIAAPQNTEPPPAPVAAQAVVLVPPVVPPRASNIAANGVFLNPCHFIPVSSGPGPGLVSRKPEEWPPHLTHERFVSASKVDDKPEEVFSGRLLVRLEVEEFLVLGGTQTEGTDQKPRLVAPFRLGGVHGSLAIPGSSLRGLLSSIVEQASNSALRVLSNVPSYLPPKKERKQFDEAKSRDRDLGRWEMSLSAGPGRQRPRLGYIHDHFQQYGNADLLPLHKDDGRTHLTLAEQLFGFIEDRATPAQTLSGRIRIANALPHKDHPPGLSETTKRLKILDSPKPPSPVFYFKNRDGSDEFIPKLDVKTRGSLPQGRKVFLHRRELVGSDWQTDPANNDLPPRERHLKQKADVTPIEKDSVFWFHIDFDNASRLELEVLCYAVRSTPEFRHKLGMARPLGLGKSRLDPVGLFLVDRIARYGVDPLTGNNSGRYHRVWSEPGYPAATTWPDRYANERAAMTGPPAAVAARAPAMFSQDYRERIRGTATLSHLTDVLSAIELIGDPGRVRHPVHYPQPATRRERDTIAGRDTGNTRAVVVEPGVEMERNSYEWFVQNESEGAKGQSLRPLTAANTCNFTELPALDRSRRGEAPLPSCWRGGKPPPELTKTTVGIPVTRKPEDLEGELVECRLTQRQPKVRFDVIVGSENFKGALVNSADLYKAPLRELAVGGIIQLRVKKYNTGTYLLVLP